MLTNIVFISPDTYFIATLGATDDDYTTDNNVITYTLSGKPCLAFFF